MATEYKCDICGKPATFHITKIIGGKKVKVHLCSECAEKASLDAANLPLELFPKLKELEQQVVMAKTSGAGICPNCGTPLSEMEKGARFSCTECYDALGARLFELFAQMHAATEHVGKKPKKHSANSFVSTEKENTENPSESVALDDGVPEGDFISGGQSPEFDCDFGEDSACADSPVQQSGDPENEKSLEAQLSEAISEERYEDAAKLRDKIKKLSGNNK